MFISLANVKAFKDVIETTHDDELARLIPVVQAFIETYCSRTFERQAAITEYHSTAPGQTKVLLRCPPIASIATIHDDPERAYGAATLVAATDYVRTHNDAGIVMFTRALSSGIHNLKVVYAGGYAADDYELQLLEHAGIELIWLARDKGHQALLGLSAKSVADSSMTFRHAWPADVKEILDQYRFSRG